MLEATILAGQMQAELPSKTVAGFDLRGADKLQQMGFFNKDSADFERLVDRTVQSVASRGNVMVMSLTGEQRLILFPEYGGEVFFYENDRSLPARYHFRLDLSEASVLTVRINSIGGVHALSAAGLAEHYIIKRDFDLAGGQGCVRGGAEQQRVPGHHLQSGAAPHAEDRGPQSR